MAPHSSTLAWKIPWMEEPGALQSMGSLGVEHDWATSLSLCIFMLWKGKWQPTPVFLPGESQGWGSLWAAVYGVTQSRTRLKRLSSSSRASDWCLVECLVRTIRVGKGSRHLPWWPNPEWMLGTVGEPSRKEANEGWGKKEEWVGRKNQSRCFCPQIRMNVLVVWGS